MTKNSIEYAKLQEEKRANKEREDIQRKGNRVSGAGLVPKFIQAGADIAKLFSSGVSKKNDPSWYNMDKRLVQDVARLSFLTPLGSPLLTEANPTVRRNIPGICAIGWVPTIGTTASAGTSVADVAAKQVYAFVRHANSGSSNYDAPDLALYIYSMDQAISYWAKLCQIYSLAMTVKSENRYYYKSMLASLGVDPDSIISNLASFRAYINLMATRLNAFYIPKTFPLLSRHVWMNTAIFKDSPVKKSQEYVFVQESYGYYDEINGRVVFSNAKQVKGGSANFTPTTLNAVTGKAENGLSYDDLISWGNFMINQLINSESIGIMSGDILKAYGNANVFTVPQIGDDYHIESEYSPEILMQITNATLVGNISNHDIGQNPTTGYLYQGANVSGSFVGMTCDMTGYNDIFSGADTTGKSVNLPKGLFQNKILNFYKDDVSEDEVMVSTRLMVGFDPNNLYTFRLKANQNLYGITECGTEICTLAYFKKLEVNPNNASQLSDSQFATASLFYITTPINAVPVIQGKLLKFGDILKFDWAPYVLTIGATEAAKPDAATTSINININSYTDQLDNRDSANYTTINNQVLSNLHYVAVLSELAVPMLGTSVRSAK